MAQRRSFATMTDPGPDCQRCGHRTERVFSPTANIIVPIAFRTFLTGGAPAGGQVTWEDIHGDRTMRDLAHDDSVVPYNEAMSKPGAGTKTTGLTPGEHRAMETAFVEAKAELAARGSE